MTADVELLPLPPLHIAQSVEPVDYPNVAQALMDYASANVAHATAAKDAEIEALRAEVERMKDMAMMQAARAAAAEREAERLAEALRPHIEDLERSAVVLDQYPAMAPTAAEMRKAAAELRAALHPTAAQEEGK